MTNTSRRLIKAYNIDMSTNLIGANIGQLHIAHQSSMFLLMQIQSISVRFDLMYNRDFTLPYDTECRDREKQDYLAMNTPLQLIN